MTDGFGRKLAGGMKPGVTSTTSDDIEKRLEIQAALILKMAEGYVPYDGDLLWSSIRWEKILALFFLLSGGYQIVCVTLDGKSSFENVIDIHAVIKKWKPKQLA